MAATPATKAKPSASPKPMAKKSGSLVTSATKKSVAKTAATKKVAETVTLKTVFEQLGETYGLPKKQSHGLLSDFVARVTGILKNGDRMRMSGLGIIEVKDRPARMGRNPATGAAVKIAASKKIAFRAAKELKEAV
jgi:DNA-binding protein HU-beta